MRLFTTSLIITTALATNAAQAANITLNDLPAQIQTELLDSGCVYPACGFANTNSINSTTDLNYLEAFTIQRGSFQSGVQFNWLIRYHLDRSSKTNSTPYTGDIWLEAPMFLSLSNPNEFRIYTDQISPNPDGSYNYWPANNSTWIFSMSASAAMNGGGLGGYGYNGDDNSWNPLPGRDTLEIIDGIVVCIECSISVDLSLVGLTYNDFGQSWINPADSRSTLLHYNDWFDTTESTTREFNVQPVPLPAALWLFGSGIIGLLGTARRKAS